MIFITKGTATMGCIQRDKDGNVTKSTPARFEIDDQGPCVAIGQIDPDTMQIQEPVKDIFGDWDSAGYLARILEMLKPGRAINIPPFKKIITDAMRDGDYSFCDHCPSIECRDCIVNEWKED